jgi:hypothetical protein
MIIRAEVDFKELLSLGKEFPWPRPPSCPGCGGPVWGHGFVRRYFDVAPEGCWIKRYHCPGCGKIITLRPKGYWPRFWCEISNIRSGLEARIKTECWPPWLKRQVGGHWLRALGEQVKKILGLAVEIFSEGFDELIRLGWVPVSRSKNGVAIPQSC